MLGVTHFVLVCLRLLYSVQSRDPVLDCRQFILFYFFSFSLFMPGCYPRQCGSSGGLLSCFFL